jgi:hypothetical protein
MHIHDGEIRPYLPQFEYTPYLLAVSTSAWMFSGGVCGAIAQPGPRMNPLSGFQTSINSRQASSTWPGVPKVSKPVLIFPSRHAR